jgi:signal transduction histidine kinase/integral membrane sensor domain MASE1/ActR/RegA family two-component response regulator
MRQWLRYFAINLAIAAVYFGAAKLGLSLADPGVSEQVTIVWPPTGIALFVFLVLGYRHWPGIVLGAFLANMTANESVPTACLIALGNTLEGILGAWLLRVFHFNSLERLKDVVRLVVLAAGLSTTVSATIGVTSLCLAGQEWTHFSRLWLLWWFGDAMGNLVMAPLLLTWLRRPAPRWPLGRIVEGAFLALSFILLGQLVFGGESMTGFKNYPLEYMVFPFVIWAALHFGQYGASTITFMASIIAISGTLAQCGPFAKGSALESLFLLQIFMGVVAMTGLVLAAITTERYVGESRRITDYAVVQILADSPTLQEAVPRILQTICETLDWDIGAVWMVNPKDNMLHCLEIWQKPTFPRPEFSQICHQTRFPPGVGMPGRVLDLGRPVWIVNVALDANFSRAAMASQVGLHSAFAFPILSGNQTLGVVEFFSRQMRPPEPDLLQMFTTVGHQLGQFIDRRTAEDELQARLQELAANDRRKDEFLAMLAHELRNPLAPIRNALHILQTPSADASLQQMAEEVLDRQTQQLTRLVDDLLDVSRITRGKIQLHPETIELATVVKRAVEIARPLIETQEHQFTVSLPPEPVCLRGDLVRLAQALANILNNAAKYTPKHGHISLVAERHDAEIIIRVRDDGIGIAPEFLPRIFDLFAQADRSLDRAQGGLGIGLTLVKTLLEMHGGSVQASSPGLGQGSEFMVRLPALAAPQGNGKRPDGQNIQIEDRLGRRILIVDDNPDATQTLATLMRLWNHEVQIAHDGSSALAVAKTFQPDVAFLDVGLPGMNGFEVAKQLRRLWDRRSLLLVGLSGYGQDEDRLKAREAGIDHYLVKPVPPEVLRDFLLKTQRAK